MAKELIDVKTKLSEYRFRCDLKQKVPCSKQENKEYLTMIKNGIQLPEGVYRYVYEYGEESDEFYTVYEPALTQDEVMEYIAFKQLDMLCKIKKGVYFFVWLTVIAMVLYLFARMSGML